MTENQNLSYIQFDTEFQILGWYVQTNFQPKERKKYFRKRKLGKECIYLFPYHYIKEVRIKYISDASL